MWPSTIMLQQSTAAVVLIVLSLHHSNVHVHAFPTSAGNCPKGIAAVGGSHLQFGPDFDNRPGRAGTLESEGITLSIGGTILQPGVTASFPEATDLEWTIKAVDTAVPYEGVALRVEAAETNTFTLTTTSDGLDELTQCDFEAGNVLGIEHRNKNKKTTSAGVMRFDLTGPVSIDLTTVFTNGDSEPPDNQSIYAHTAYSINIGAPVVTPAPVSAVTPAPVSAVTPAPPVSVATPAPVTSPIEIPVAVPVQVPIAVPVDAPVEAPIEAPVESPVETTSPAPVEGTPPTELPIEAPVEAPIETPATEPPATEPPATEPPGTEPPASTEPPDEGDSDGKGKGGKGDSEGKGGKGDSEGKEGKGDKEGKGKGDKESKEKGKGKEKKEKKGKGKKASKAGGSEKKGKGKGIKGDGDGKGGKGDVRRRRL
jgi:hypothetical protein